ncbi:WD repeat-containing protein 76 [Anabrus simplex]|uniref:WD repeat-containing protein 76 n=1 Tax=Anabrus simplex TaxID=316456 RepID=UPI0035A2EFC3
MSSALRERRRKRSLSPDSDTPKKSSSNRRSSYFFPRDSDEDSKPKTPEGGERAEADEKPELPDQKEREAYEEMRKKNIEEKNQMLKLFGFSPLPAFEPGTVKKKPPRVVKRSVKAKPVPALRLTLRSRTSTGKAEVKKEVEDEKEGEESEEELDEEIGDMKMVPINNEEDDKINHEEFINNLLPHLKKTKNPSGQVVDLDSYKKIVKQLQLRESTVQKVGVKRTHSMAIHPSESKVLIVTGDAIGTIGIWDVQSTADPQVYHPHKAPVFCTSFCPTYSTRLYTTCIDGTVRRCDLDKLMFERVYVSKGRIAKNYHTPWHCQRSSTELLVAHGNGSVGFIDMRSGEDSVQFYNCHERSVRTVHVHPVEDQFFVTASGIGEVCIWDSRFINKKSPKPVCSMPHSKGLKSAFFSPGGSLLLTTCNDDRLRIFNTENVQAGRSQVVTTVIHDNQTGRWLTPFKAMWHPRRDDVFVIGAMDPNRAIDVYGVHGLLLRKIRDPLLTTILSVVQFHPSLDIIAGANSSGRVHVFMPPE